MENLLYIWIGIKIVSIIAHKIWDKDFNIGDRSLYSCTEILLLILGIAGLVVWLLYINDEDILTRRLTFGIGYFFYQNGLLYPNIQMVLSIVCINFDENTK